MKILYYNADAKHSGGIDVEWLYGIDLIEQLREKYSDWQWIGCRGYTRPEMVELYKSADCLLRPTRHDGLSTMVYEAQHFNLPVVHTYPIPGVILVEPKLRSIEDALLRITGRDKSSI